MQCIAAKYSHPQTQMYRDKIKALIAGKPYVPSATTAEKSASSSSLHKSGPASTSSSSSTKKKSSKKKTASSNSAASGQLFAFDPAPEPQSNGEDDDEDSFESFVAPKPVPQVPTYGEPKVYDRSTTAISSDGASGLPKADGKPPEEDDDPLFSAMLSGWSKITEVAAATKEKLEKSTSELKQKVEQSSFGQKANSFIQSLWSGEMEDSAAARENSQKATSVVAARVVPGEEDAEGWLNGSSQNNAPVQTKLPKAEQDSWGAWDGGADEDEDVVDDEEGWGAWSKKKPDPKPAAEQKKEVAKKEAVVVTSNNSSNSSPAATGSAVKEEKGADVWGAWGNASANVQKESDPWGAWGAESPKAEPQEKKEKKKKKTKKSTKEADGSKGASKAGSTTGTLVDLDFGGASSSSSSTTVNKPSLLDVMGSLDSSGTSQGNLF